MSSNTYNNNQGQSILEAFQSVNQVVVKQQTNFYYTDSTLSDLRTEYNFVSLMAGYNDPDYLHEDYYLDQGIESVYNSLPAYQELQSLYDEIAFWTNPPNDTSLLVDRYNQRFELASALNTQLQQEYVTYSQYYPEMAEQIPKSSQWLSDRFQSNWNAVIASDWYNDWHNRFDNAYYNSSTYQNTLQPLEQFYQSYPELQEFYWLINEINTFLYSLNTSNSATLNAYQTKYQAVYYNPDIVAEISEQSNQYTTLINSLLPDSYKAEVEKYYEKLNGLVVNNSTYIDLSDDYESLNNILENYQKAIVDAMDQGNDVTSWLPQNYEDAANLLRETATNYEELNKFWYALYNSDEYLKIQDELIANTQSILESVQPQIEAAQEQLKSSLLVIPEVKALINAEENYISDLRNEFPTLDSKYARLEELESYLAQPISTNAAPQYLQFDLEQNGNTLALQNAWVYDADGSQDVQRIDFWLQTAGGSWIDVEDPTSIQPWSEDNRWASFDHSISLNGYHDGNYMLWAQAGDSQGATSNVVQANFTIQPSSANSPPQYLQFDLEQHGNTLALQNAWIHDGDGSQDIEWIDFWLQTAGGSWIDVEDPTSIQPWSEDNRWASFNHSISLNGYHDGNYMLWAQAGDSQGATSNIVQANFTIQSSSANSPPQYLQFDLDRSTYQAGDILALENAWIYDADGSQDVQWIDFWFQMSDGSWIDIYDVTDIETWSGDRSWGSFEYYLDLSGLPAGNYMVWAQAVDSQGNTSNGAGVYFDILTGSQLSESASSMDQSDPITGTTQLSTNVGEEVAVDYSYSDVVDSSLVYEFGTTEAILSLDGLDDSYLVGYELQISEAKEIFSTQAQSIGMLNELVYITIDQDF